MSNKLLSRLTVLCLLGTLLFGFGCAPDGPARFPIQGKVTIDGEPVAEGVITFSPADNSSGLTPGGSVIKDGTYQISKAEGLLAGEYAVSFQATKDTGKTKTVPAAMIGKTMEVPVTVNLIPDNYGQATTQKVTISSGKNTFDFEIPKRQ